MNKLKVAGLFAGIGGIEYGLHQAGMETVFLCEIDEKAQTVLREHFPGVPLHDDVTTLKKLPKVDVVTAGFPCQNLSQAGLKEGIEGSQSSLVSHVFRLLKDADESERPNWVIFENVSYIISLKEGTALNYLTSNLEALGYHWAYRIVDARAFGVPQRRLRMIMVASRTGDARSVLFSSNVENPPVDDLISNIDTDNTYGFYWTEGERGIGWTPNGVPTLKIGSKIGIPSPPAIWFPEEDFFGTPDIRDAEALQGFPHDWTAVTDRCPGAKRGDRWKQVGNAVCANMSRWIGEQIIASTPCEEVIGKYIRAKKWPKACWGYDGKRYSVEVSTWPVETETPAFKDFVCYPCKPLSLKGVTGFYTRAKRSKLINYPDEFIESLEKYILKLGGKIDD